MKRILTLAAASAAGLALATQAISATQPCTRTYSVAQFRRAALAVYAGTDTPPRGSYGHLWAMVKCQRTPGDRARARRVWWHAHDAWRNRRHPSGYDSPVLADVPGVPWSFAACVAFRESDNGTMSSNVYGIIPASGFDVLGAPLSVQKHAFHSLYVSQGTAPWSRWDGC